MVILESFFFDIGGNLLGVYLLFIKNILRKGPNLKIDSAVSLGSQGKLTYCMDFPCPPLEAGLSIDTFISYLHVAVTN
jgi:hypothetical protein